MPADPQQLTLGAKIRDNDDRMGNRVLTIIAVGGDYVRVKDRDGHESRLLVRRVHTDEKPRKTGYSLIQEQAK